MTLMQTLFSFNGRVRRTNYWLASIGTSVVLSVVAGILVIVFVIFGAAASGDGNNGDGTAALMGSMFLVWLVPLYLLALWISLALGVKRCHDRNYPGAMMLVSLVPIFGWFWALIDLGFVDGTLGANQYGPSPKGIV